MGESDGLNACSDLHSLVFTLPAAAQWCWMVSNVYMFTNKQIKSRIPAYDSVGCRISFSSNNKVVFSCMISVSHITVEGFCSTLHTALLQFIETGALWMSRCFTFRLMGSNSWWSLLMLTSKDHIILCLDVKPLTFYHLCLCDQSRVRSI